MNSYKMKKFPRINTYHMINMKYPVPMQTVVIGWFFHLMASDFIRELLNEINQFCSILKNLNSWEKILKDYSEGMKFNILIEIINPVCMSALNTPYAIKNRFTYASVMLLRETAILLDRNVKCIKFSEENITLKTLKDFADKFNELNQRVYYKYSDSPTNRKRDKVSDKMWEKALKYGIFLGLDHDMAYLD